MDDRLQKVRRGDEEEGSEWLTPQEIAQDLKVNQQTVRNWLRDKQLIGAKFGDVWRIKRSEYKRFIAEGERKGLRYEVTDEVQAFLDEHGYKALQAFGDANEVQLYVDFDPLDRNRNELVMRSSRRESIFNESSPMPAGMEWRDDWNTPPLEGRVWVEDSDEQPFRGLEVEGHSHSEVFLKLARAIHDHDKRVAATEASLATPPKEADQ